MLELAKPALDVGMFTNAREPMLEFWQQRVGLPYAEMLPVGGGLQQHRHTIGDSVLKLNHARYQLPDERISGIRRVIVAREGLDTPVDLTDPDGNAVQLVPPSHDRVEQLRVELVVNDLAAHRLFYGDILGLEATDPTTFLCGVSQLRLIEGDATPEPAQQGPGYRYLTVQVFDVIGVHAEVLARGGREGSAPVRLGDVAHVSFVRDPDGNWLELSQRKSLTGSLDRPAGA